MRHYQWLWLPVAAISYPAYCETYFTMDQAQQAIFPGASFTPSPVTLTDAQAQAIEQQSGVNVRHKDIKLWKVSSGGYFIVDDVVGKHEFITYAIGLNQDGSVHHLEIMEYKETYGYQVRDPKWLAQFTTKTSASTLELDKDIKNISGATLSSKHITDGVKRILATYAVALK
ncbi:MAG TPA: FMN-binding protein [Rickettsiales bacterium]|nr:FMN-binding protein [Rickettsiales bacterium]